MSRFIVSLCLVVFSGMAAAADTILILGDSLSAGYGLRQQDAWPALLGRRLAERKLPYRVANASISGDTSAGGRSRLPAAMAQHAPRLVIIALGANDGLRGLPPEQLRDNLAAMAAMARRAGARVILAGMDMPPNYGAAFRDRFRRAYVDAARAEGAELIPFLLAGFAQEREMFQADGIHPTAAAQPLILETIWQRLSPMLGRATPTTRAR